MSVFAPMTGKQYKSWGASKPGSMPDVGGTVNGAPQGLPRGGILALSAGFFAVCKLWCGALVFTLALPMLDSVHDSLLDVDLRRQLAVICTPRVLQFVIAAASIDFHVIDVIVRVGLQQSSLALV